ncbi:MAG: LolA family protein [Planctomycetota bacterium]
MKRPAIMMLLALLSVACASPLTEAEEKKFDELPAELRMVLDKLDEANEDLEGITADVLYTREIPLLDETEESDGSLKYMKPGWIHMNLGEPREEEICSNGNKWWLIAHRDQQVEIYEAADREDEVAEASFLTFGFGRSSRELIEDYTVELEDSDEVKDDNGETYRRWKVKFEPRNEEREARFATIQVILSDRRWLPKKIVLHESEGEIIHGFELTDVDLNPGLAEEDFDVSIPDGYSVIRPQ